MKGNTTILYCHSYYYSHVIIGVTAVEEVWLPVMNPQFCTFSDPLKLPPPNFDPQTGTVQCHVTCTYGK